MTSPMAMRLVDLAVGLNFKSSSISVTYERVFSSWLYPNFKPMRLEYHGVPSAAWSVNGRVNSAALMDVNDRQLELWMSPFGIIKLARAAGAAAKLDIDPRSGQRILSFPYKNTQVRATLLDNNLIDRVDYQSASPLHGDMRNALVFGNYRQFEGFRYPSHIVRYENDLPTLDTWINSATINGQTVVSVPPEVLERFAAAVGKAPVVTVEKLAPGVFFLAGESHHSTAIEFSDHIVIFDVPRGDARTLAVFAAAKLAIPNKPIRYAIVSHNHADHAAGLRAAVAEGVTIIAHSASKTLFQQALQASHTLAPDHLSKHPKQTKLIFIDDNMVLSDASRRVEIHRLEGMRHSDDMLVAYLPQEKILCQVDVFTLAPLPPANTPTAAPVTREIEANTLSLYDNLVRLKLQVEQIAPGHGRLGKMSDLLEAVGKAAQ
nr:MBL fold metallo-hydrolase [uncultured Undibacterium sp.]